MSHLYRPTRRAAFKVMAGGLAGWQAQRLRASTGSPFTIAMVPDPQYLANTGTCAGATAYNRLIQWAIDNRNLLVGGAALNVKGFLQVGDCIDNAPTAGYGTAQQISVNAFALAEAASPKMFVIRCLGNHDYGAYSVLDRSTVNYMWREDKNGPWSPSNVAAIYSGGMDLGGGDVAFFGGAYADPTYPLSTANNYMRLYLQGRKILVLSLEFFPRASVLSWAQAIHDTYPDHDCWMTTHGYQTTTGAQSLRSDLYGPDDYSMGAAPAANCGTEMWGGASGWTGLNRWSNLAMVTCGHYVDGYTGGSGWVWKQNPANSISARRQTVQQVFCNCQQADLSNFCLGDPSTPDLTSDVAHLMLLRITPATNKLEAFLVSTNSGKWTGTTGVRNGADPIQLFNVDFPPMVQGMFPQPGGFRR